MFGVDLGETNTHYKVRQYSRKFIDIVLPPVYSYSDTFALTIFISYVKCILVKALYRAGKENEAKQSDYDYEIVIQNMKHPQQVMHFYKKLNFKSVLKCGVKVVVYLT